MTTLAQVAKTMSDEFAATVAAAEGAVAAGIDAASNAMAMAGTERAKARDKIRAMREQAAQLVRASLLLEDEAEAAYHKSMSRIFEGLNELRPTTQQPATTQLKRINGRLHRIRGPE